MADVDDLMFDRKEYLKRIGIEADDLEATETTLRMLQHMHLLAVPFENLDIHSGREIVTDIDLMFDKVVGRRRGGFCYELNGLFNELLRALGYTTRLISARVFNGTSYGPEYDHAAIIVTIDDGEYLADVGFGDFSAEPLRFAIGGVQSDDGGTFTIRKYDDEYYDAAKLTGDEWKSEYIFKDTARTLDEFAEMCRFHQTSPDSHFTKGRLISILTTNGRKTLTDGKFIQKLNGDRIEEKINSPDEFITKLRAEFNYDDIDLIR